MWGTDLTSTLTGEGQASIFVTVDHASTECVGVRVVLKSGQLSTWLTRELRALDWPVVCVDARQAHRALSGRLNKSDAADAEGLAQLARTGWYREVHARASAATAYARCSVHAIA